MKRSLSSRQIKEIDKSGMLETLNDFPFQCKSALETGKAIMLEGGNPAVSSIVLAGVGGSAVAADLLKGFLYDRCPVPISVIRGYHMPAYIDKSVLVIILSYSGDTEEAISCFEHAKNKGARRVCVCSGGRLAKLAKEKAASLVEVPRGMAPRLAIGYLSISSLYVLFKAGIIEDPQADCLSAIKVIEELHKTVLNPRSNPKDNVAKNIALRLYNKLVFAYSSSPYFDFVAQRFKNQINENCKAFACSQALPEMVHNEIEGWSHPDKLLTRCIAVMFRDQVAPRPIDRKMELVKKILAEKGVLSIDVWARGESLLSNILSLVHIGDYISFYLAILYGTDPTVIDNINRIKKDH